MSTSKPRIGLLGLMLELYDKARPELRPSQNEFAGQLVDRLRTATGADVTFTGICNTREAVDKTMQKFVQADVDLIVVVHFSYAPSLIAMQALRRTNVPIVLFNTQRKRGIGDDFSGQDILENHGMHGQQDLANVLVRTGRSFSVVTGYWEDDEPMQELAEWATAAKAARLMRKSQIGLFGYAFQDMADFGVDETTFMDQVGPHIMHIGLDAIADAMDAAPVDEVDATVAAEKQQFTIDPQITPEVHRASARAEWAMRKVIADYDLNAYAMHYEVLGGDPRFTVLPFTAATKLMTEGIGFGGEGDVTSAAAVIAMHYLTGCAAFSEMFCMDFEGGAILMSHFAEGNLNFAAGKPALVYKDGWVGSGGPSTALAFSFAPGPVTLLNLTVGAKGQVKLIASTAEILDYTLPEPGTPHCKLQPSCELSMFLDAYMYHGGSHHVALVKGNELSIIDKFAAIMELPLYII